MRGAVAKSESRQQDRRQDLQGIQQGLHGGLRRHSGRSACAGRIGCKNDKKLNGLAKRKVNRKAVNRKIKPPTRAEREAMLAASVGIPSI